MKTFCFIGSDKNAGKTTAMVFLYGRLCERKKGSESICLTSIGINGESVDAYENRSKPSIPIKKGSVFVTAGEHLEHLKGQYSVLGSLHGSQFRKNYIIARALTSFPAVLEGPNDREEVIFMKKAIDSSSKNCTCLIDGSIDRQFIGHPLVSDGICFALLLSSRREQLTKARDLLSALTLKKASEQVTALVEKHSSSAEKSLLINSRGEILYHSEDVPFLDQRLRKVSLDYKNESCILYLRGSLTRSLYSFYAPFRNWKIVLDNFTLYQNISTRPENTKAFLPGLALYHKVPLHSLYLKQEARDCPIRLPVDVPVYNLFRDNLHEIGI